ncbi:hypothetical protein JXL19_06965 [bacterium]|nr:hypothetical protein [bacterium]
MRYFRYWWPSVVVLFLAFVSLCLFVPRIRQRDVSKSDKLNMNEGTVTEPLMSPSENDILSFPNQLKLLGASWTRDPFSLKPLQKGQSKDVKDRDKSSNEFDGRDSGLIQKPSGDTERDKSPSEFSGGAPDIGIPKPPATPSHTKPSAKTDDKVSMEAAINESLRKMKLNGIVFFDNQYMALINDSGLKEGDTISDFKIAEIKRRHVVLKDRLGNSHKLELN